MPNTKRSATASATALTGIWTVTLTSFIIALLYLARSIFIPLALAALLTFLLAPLVTRLERWLGRVGAVLMIVFLILGGVTVGGWVLTSQLVDLASKLPDYQNNIQSKLRSIQAPSGPTFSRFKKAIEELKKDLPGGTKTKTEPVSALPPPLVVAPLAPPAVVAIPAAAPESETKGNPFYMIRVVAAPLMSPLGTAALVFLLVIFMLLQREDLRSRVIRLIGQGHISATTRAMDDAGTRVAKYLLTQFILNICYGAIVAIGLYFIGVPNAVLWGVSAAILRFIPYLGPWIGAALPTALALAVSPGWTMPLLTIALFVVLELVSNNIMEPWLYGSSTGVTPLALIFAALFWTWLWGPVGLVLATPMTVCLVVMGRHIPKLSFFGVLLSDQEALTPAEDCYYRLLTAGEQDELEFVESYLKTHTIADLYDSVFIPVVARLEADYRADLVDDEQRVLVEQSLHDIVEDLGARPPATTEIPASEENAHEPLPVVNSHIYCVTAESSRDEFAGMMLSQVLTEHRFTTERASAKMPVDDLLLRIQQGSFDVVCISVVAPSTVLHARYLCLKIRSKMPGQKILVGLWGAVGDVTASVRRVRESGAELVATTMAQAVEQIRTELGAPPVVA